VRWYEASFIGPDLYTVCHANVPKRLISNPGLGDIMSSYTIIKDNPDQGHRAPLSTSYNAQSHLKYTRLNLKSLQYGR